MLKSNSHIIPRWMLAPLKENGRLVTVSSSDGINDRVQADMKGSIVCEACESRFSREDAFAAAFIRDSKFLIARKPFTDTAGTIELEYHDGNYELELLCFNLGIVIRMHLYENSKGLEGLCGPSFERLVEMYLNRSCNKETLPYISSKNIALDRTIIYPEKQRIDGRIAINVMYWGYRFLLFTDKRTHPISPAFEAFLNEKHIPIIIIQKDSDNFLNSMSRYVKKLPYKGRK